MKSFYLFLQNTFKKGGSMKSIMKFGVLSLFLSLFLVASAKAVYLRAGSLTFHWTDWEVRVTDTGDELFGIFRVDQILDENNDVIWSDQQDGTELTGYFSDLTVVRFDGEDAGDIIGFTGGILKVYLDDSPDFDPTYQGSSDPNDYTTVIDGDLWLDLQFVTGRLGGDTANYTLTTIMSGSGDDPEGVLALTGTGRALLEVVGGSAASLFDTNKYSRYDASYNVIGYADMSLDASVFIRNTGVSPYTNPKDGWDVWSKDPLGAHVVPEPSTVMLVGSGILIVGTILRRKARTKDN